MIDDEPKLHPIRTTRIPHTSWVPAGIELLDGWVNVRIWSHDRVLGRDLYVTEPCPGLLHMESTVTEVVVQYADDDDNIFNEWGDMYDDRPVVIDTLTADPPHTWSQHVDPDWQLSYVQGGCIGSCPADKVPELLAEQGFGNAMLKPDDWVDPDGD